MLIVISSGFSRCEYVSADMFHMLSYCLFIDVTLATSRFTFYENASDWSGRLQILCLPLSSLKVN
jgi:hypothetical protein